MLLGFLKLINSPLYTDNEHDILFCLCSSIFGQEVNPQLDK